MGCPGVGVLLPGALQGCGALLPGALQSAASATAWSSSIQYDRTGDVLGSESGEAACSEATPLVCARAEELECSMGAPPMHAVGLPLPGGRGTWAGLGGKGDKGDKIFGRTALLLGAEAPPALVVAMDDPRPLILV
jgi:hypothetical protein